MQFAPETACAVRLAAGYHAHGCSDPFGQRVRGKDGRYLLPAAQVTLRPGSVL